MRYTKDYSRRKKKGILVCILVLLVFFLTLSNDFIQVSAKIRYKKYYNSRFDYTVQYPAKFTEKRYPQNGDGIWMWTKKNDAELTISGAFNIENDDGYSYYDKFTDEYRAKQGYSYKAGKDFLRQSYQEEGRNVFYYIFITGYVDMSFVIKYPPEQKSYYKKVIKTMKKSIRRNINPNA